MQQHDFHTRYEVLTVVLKHIILGHTVLHIIPEDCNFKVFMKHSAYYFKNLHTFYILQYHDL
jgi:hypothetical protein